MGWFWGSSNSNGGDDPTKNLDPTLKDYLDKERPATYAPTKEVPTSYTQQLPSQPTQSNTKPQPDVTEPNKPVVPSASLFPDGRYAHIWKDYKPLSEIEAATDTRSPAEKVIDQSKSRKSVINRAALENCSEESIALMNCTKTGNWQDKAKARMTLCREQNRKYSRCCEMQSKFLQALGYGSGFEFDPDKEERIQMHADKLYHQMLDYEARVEEAKAAGLEPPPPQSLFNPSFKPAPQQAAKTDSGQADDLEIPGGHAIPKGLNRKELKDMTPHERELQIQVLKQKEELKGKYMETVTPFLDAQNQAKEARRRKFSGWFGETIGNWLA